MKEKPLNLNFHQIVVSSKVQTNSDEEDKKKKAAISSALGNLPKTVRPVVRSESNIELYKGVEQKGAYYLGTLINKQTSGIAARYKSKTQQLTPLPFDDEDDGLGHPVNFLFDPELNILMIESVRNGVTAEGFCNLLSVNVDLPKIEPAIIINPAKMQQFYKMKHLKKFKVRIARVENGSVFTQKKKRAVLQIAGSADNTNTDILEYVIGVRKRNDELNRAFVQNAVQGFLGFKDSEEVELLEVEGKEEEDGRFEKINLIQHALRDKIMVQKLRLHGDFAREERFDQLVAKYNSHKQDLDTVYKLKRIT